MTFNSAAPLDLLYLSRIKQLQEEGFTLEECNIIAGYEKDLSVMQNMFTERMIEKSVELNIKVNTTPNVSNSNKIAGEQVKSKAKLYLVK